LPGAKKGRVKMESIPSSPFISPPSGARAGALAGLALVDLQPNAAALALLLGEGHFEDSVVV
jgi:hypothetical protein